MDFLEHITAVVAVMKDNFTRGIGVAVGFSIVRPTSLVAQKATNQKKKQKLAAFVIPSVTILSLSNLVMGLTNNHQIFDRLLLLLFNPFELLVCRSALL